MAITISGENNNDRILAADGVIDQISGFNIVGVITATTFTGNLIGNVTGNLTGNVNNTSPLLLQTGGYERLRLTGNNEIGIAGANYGSAGQVLTSGGSGSAVTWSAIPSQVSIANNADNRVITGGSGVNLNGEANLTFDGTTLTNTGTGSRNNTIYTSTNNSVFLTLQNSQRRFNINNVTGGAFTIYDSTASAERFRIDSSGNVGIDETGTVLGKLHVVGGRASGTAYNAAVFAGGQNSTSGSGVKLYLSGCENDPISRGVILESIMTDNANAHRFSILVGGSSAAPTERFRINSEGRVKFLGNQSTAPGGELGVRYDKTGTTTINIENLSTSSVNNQARLALRTNNGYAYFSYYNQGELYVSNPESNGYFVYYGNSGGGASQRLRINSNGRVSLSGNITNNAPSSPDGNLHIQDSSAGSVTADAGGDQLVLESSGNTGMSILSPGSGESTIFFGNPGTNGQKDGYIRYYHESHSTTANRRTLSFIVGGGDNERLRITGDKVMFSVDAKVDSNNARDLGADGAKWKTLYLGTQLNIDAASTTDMIMLDAAGTNFARIGYNSASGTAILDLRSEGHTRFLTGGNNERLRITSDGEVHLQTANYEFTENTFRSKVSESVGNNNPAVLSGAMTSVEGSKHSWNNTGGILDLPDYKRSDWQILEVYGEVNPNTGGSGVYSDPFFMIIYQGYGWNGSAVTSYIYAQQFSPMARDVFPSGTGNSGADGMSVVWYDGSNETNNCAYNSTTHYLRIKLDTGSFNTTHGCGASVRIFRRL